MSSRTALAVVAAGAYPEEGPTTKTLENLDVTNGNKIPYEPGLQVCVINTHSSALNVTLTYDDDAGVERTKAVSIPANNGFAVLEFASRMLRHVGDAAENGLFVWLTGAGTAGQLRARVHRRAPQQAVA